MNAGSAEGELGELGMLIDAWMDGERFRPTQREVAKELRVSAQQVSIWMRGQYKGMLKPEDVRRLARMMTRPGQSEQEVYDEVLLAVLRDTGHLSRGRRLGDAPVQRRAR